MLYTVQYSKVPTPHAISRLLFAATMRNAEQVWRLMFDVRELAFSAFFCQARCMHD